MTPIFKSMKFGDVLGEDEYDAFILNSKSWNWS